MIRFAWQQTIHQQHHEHRHHRIKVRQRSTHACPPSIYRHGASSTLLAVWLDQRSVRHGGSTAHGPLSIVGGLSAPHRTSRLSHLSTLQWCWRDGRTSGVTLPSTRPGVVGVMAKSPLSKRPKMPMELPGEDRAVNRPPDREWKRESSQQQQQQCPVHQYECQYKSEQVYNNHHSNRLNNIRDIVSPPVHAFIDWVCSLSTKHAAWLARATDEFTATC